jgi:hypothetical protein
VIVCNIDELIWHPTPLDALEREQQAGVTLIRPDGYDMVTWRLPRSQRPLERTVRRGMAFPHWSKPCVFRPDAIDEINFVSGRHRAEPTGVVREPARVDFQLRHHKWLGLPYTLQRHHELRDALRDGDRARRLAPKWERSDLRLAREYLRRRVRARRLPVPTAAAVEVLS